MFVQIGLAILVLAVLVAAYMSSKYWHWAHVTVMVSLFFSALGFTFLTAETMRIRDKWQTQEQNYSEQLEKQIELNTALKEGTDDSGVINRLIANEVRISEEAESITGIGQIEHQLRMMTRARGRVWRGAQPQTALSPETGALTVNVPTESPLRIESGAILFAFEQGPANPADPQSGAQYLGEFRVTQVGDQSLTLEPVLQLNEFEIQRLGSSQTPWALYERMPADNHEMFARYSDDQLRQIMPEASAFEYVRDGTDWKVDDGEWVKEGYNEEGVVVPIDQWDDTTKYRYRRELRDYAYLFQDLAERQVELFSSIQAVTEDTSKLKATLAGAKQVEQQRLAEQEKLKFDLARRQRDRKFIEQHLADVQQQLKKAKTLLARTIRTNAQLADQLAGVQQSFGPGGLEPAPSRPAVDIDAL